jgi:hypothetical protein
MPPSSSGTRDPRASPSSTTTDHIERLAVERDAARAVLDEAAAALTAIRTEAAGRLGAAVTEELHALAMPDARLVVAVAEGVESAHGRDDVAILLAPHPGAEPRPSPKGASGGELSRVMLAIEVVIAGTDPVPTFVFDEVDAGIGGAAAIEVGRRLARLARTSQVIAVTHLAQVAAFANNHQRREGERRLRSPRRASAGWTARTARPRWRGFSASPTPALPSSTPGSCSRCGRTDPPAPVPARQRRSRTDSRTITGMGTSSRARSRSPRSISTPTRAMCS